MFTVEQEDVLGVLPPEWAAELQGADLTPLIDEAVRVASLYRLEITGTATDTATNTLIDKSADFRRCRVGAEVRNTTTGGIATVTAVSRTELTLDADIFSAGDGYAVEDGERILAAQKWYAAYLVAARESGAALGATALGLGQARETFVSPDGFYLNLYEKNFRETVGPVFGGA